MPGGKRASRPVTNQTEQVLRVLLIEDDEDHILLGRTSLTRELPGCQVDAARNGQAALAKMSRTDYDIVILDHRLPDMNGLEVLAEIKEQGYERPVIMVTGMGSEEVAVQALQVGAIDYAVKSSGWHRNLPRLVQRSLEKYSLEQERARLDQEVLRRNRELAALNAIAAALSQSLGLKEVLDAALKETLAVLEAEGGLIYLLDETSRTFAPAVYRGISQDVLWEVTGFKMGEGLSGWVAESGEPLVIANLSADPKNISPAANRKGWRSYAGVPVKSKDEVLGVMTLVTRQEGHFKLGHLGLLSHIGNQIGVAIENAQLHEQELSMATLAERNLVAGRIHDDMAQTLSYLGLKVDYLKQLLSSGRGTELERELDEMRKVIDDLYDVARQDILELRRPLPGGSDLLSSLAQVLQTFEQESGIKYELIVDKVGGPDVLSTWARFQILYIVREALANVRKHARASKVLLTLDREEEDFRIAVEDDGIGFDASERDKRGEIHLGLEIMEGRAKQIGARLEVDSQPGCGTKIVVRIPTEA